MTQFYAGFSTMQASFVGYIKDGTIYSTDANGQQITVGVTSKAYEDLKADYDGVFARCQEYYDRLVKLGEIVPELTGEALIKAQADQLTRAARLIEQMTQNQEHLLSVIRNLNQSQKITEDKVNESLAIDSQSDTGHIPTVETADNGIQPDPRSVPKHKARSSQGNNRKKPAA